MKFQRALLVLVQVFCLLAVAACSSTIAPFSQRAYEYATDLKVESLSIMNRAEFPYTENESRVERLKMDLDKAYEFAKGRPRNEHSTRQWEILIDPEKNLVGGFFTRWESEGQLNYPFIEQSQRLISDAFDTVIGLESGKIRLGD